MYLSIKTWYFEYSIDLCILFKFIPRKTCYHIHISEFRPIKKFVIVRRLAFNILYLLLRIFYFLNNIIMKVIYAQIYVFFKFSCKLSF